MEVRIDGKSVGSERDVHAQLARQLDLGEHYGHNVAALRDRLLRDVPRPLHIVWADHAVSRERLGGTFTSLLEVLAEAQRQDREFGWDDQLTYDLA